MFCHNYCLLFAISQIKTLHYRIEINGSFGLVICGICDWQYVQYKLLLNGIATCPVINAVSRIIRTEQLSQFCVIIYYLYTSNISRTLVGNKIADHSDVVGAAPTTSSFATRHLASKNWANTPARRDEKNLSVGICFFLYLRSDNNSGLCHIDFLFNMLCIVSGFIPLLCIHTYLFLITVMAEIEYNFPM